MALERSKARWEFFGHLQSNYRRYYTATARTSPPMTEATIRTRDQDETHWEDATVEIWIGIRPTQICRIVNPYFLILWLVHQCYSLTPLEHVWLTYFGFYHYMATIFKASVFSKMNWYKVRDILGYSGIYHLDVSVGGGVEAIANIRLVSACNEEVQAS